MGNIKRLALQLYTGNQWAEAFTRRLSSSIRPSLTYAQFPAGKSLPRPAYPLKTHQSTKSRARLAPPRPHSSSPHCAHAASARAFQRRAVAGAGTGLWESQEPSLCSLLFSPVLRGNVLFLLQENTLLEEKKIRLL